MPLCIYYYYPQPLGTDQGWTSPNQLYDHLIRHADERARITAEICSMDPGQPFTVLIYHPCLPKMLPFSTVDSDWTFLSRLETLFDFGPDGQYFRSSRLR